MFYQSHNIGIKWKSRINTFYLSQFQLWNLLLSMSSLKNSNKIHISFNADVDSGRGVFKMAVICQRMVSLLQLCHCAAIPGNMKLLDNLAHAIDCFLTNVGKLAKQLCHVKIGDNFMVSLLKLNEQRFTLMRYSKVITACYCKRSNNASIVKLHQLFQKMFLYWTLNYASLCFTNVPNRPQRILTHAKVIIA